MYVEKKIEKIKEFLTLINEELNRIIGFNQSLDNTYAEKKISAKAEKKIKNISKEEFLKNRFPNNNTNNKITFEAKIENLDENSDKEGDTIMTGSITLRGDGRWMGRFYFLGKRYYVYDHSKMVCIQKMRDKKKQLKDNSINIDIISNTMRLNSWFDYYYETYKKQKIKNSTFLKAQEIYTRYVRKTIGKEKINILNSIKIQSFINSMASYSQRKKIIQILNELFTVLQKEGYIRKDPMTLVVLPKQYADDASKVLTKEKILNYPDELRFLDRIKNAKCFNAVKFILYTGLRRGECLGIRWTDINMDDNYIIITQQYNLDGDSFTSPKTDAGYRKIPLLPEAKMVLQELIKNKHDSDNLIFSDLTRLTKQVCDYANKTSIYVNPHILRHTFASRCYACGIDPKLIQKWLGHETISTTLDTYTHVLDNTNIPIIEKMKGYFKEMGHLF